MDSHVLIWLDEGNDRLGQTSRKLIDDALRDSGLAASAISFWEIAMLVHKGRLKSTLDLAAWRQELLLLGLAEIPVSGSIGIQAAALKGFHGDPADRLITATALEQGATVITADERLLSWGGDVPRQDARR